MAAHYWLAYCEKFQRDRDRLADCRKRVNVMPLGVAALAGTSLPIDRQETARLLGFDSVAANSLDVSSDRDFLAEAIFSMSLIAVHLSGWAEEWILWCTTEFGFLKLPDAYTTGSSIMPQKRNPDVLELIRGKSARVIADVQQILTLVKGLPMAYNRDLQEDKEPLFDAVDTCRLALTALDGLLASARFEEGAMAAAADHPLNAATDLAEHLVAGGTPFREAHAIVGSLVRRSLDEGISLADLVVEEPRLGPDCVGLLGPGRAVLRRTTPGGGGPDPVAEQLDRARACLASEREWLDR